ncbi:unnamed protein product [Mycena citricolor]|uniref:Uncharacterized protein n=1 Tax=Mycena citricolor TaxID=2018698 RepID=A0AAD2Q5N7_9AGAR|nr:unnamed protein product [Mycena citricolor]
MSQADEQQTEERDSAEAFSEREKAIGNKLWGVYISEVEKYDQGLIDGWRSEMDGLLISVRLRTTMFSSPSIRSRVYMYLYYGLRRFNLHLVVGSGGVSCAINIIITGISSALQGLFVLVYPSDSAAELEDIRGITKTASLAACIRPISTARLPSIFDDKAWFRAVLGLATDERTERASAGQVYGCACVGVLATLFEQCAAQSPDQTERDLDFATLYLVERHVGISIPSVIPIGLEGRFAAATAGFIRKYPENYSADRVGLFCWLYGYMTDVDALRVLDTVVSEVQTEDQQEEHRDHAQEIREGIQKRLRSAHIPAESVLLGSDGE